MRIALTIVCALLCLAGCSGSSARRIPREDFQVVLREMFLTDLILERDGTLGRLADSTLVYPPILEKHGFTTEQFLATLDYYASRPARFKSLLTQLRRNINAERSAYNEKLSYVARQKELVELFNTWLKDSVPGIHDVIYRQSLLRILPPDSSQLQPWRMDRDSLYKDPALRLLPVIDTMTHRDSIPLYLTRPKTIISHLKLSINLD
ncbi:MAG TPA: DUF4296 domain-containing protein [Bacteroidales bacterium]|nr:DUF4296 domain-containing protein [Bacteroidales bacterium]